MATFNFQRFQQNMSSKIEAPVRQHLAKVYGCLGATTALATVGAYAFMVGIFQGGLLGALGSIGIILALYSWRDDGKNFLPRFGLLLAFGALTGNSLGPLLNMAVAINPQIIVNALVGTSVVFVSFTAAALVAKRGQYMFLGGILTTVLLYSMLASIANIFIRSQMVFQAQMYIGLAVMSAMILYDTQSIMEKYHMGHRDPIAHSLDLFMDIVSIFRKLLIILSQKEERDQRRKRK